MSPWLPDAELAAFVPQALTRLPGPGGEPWLVQIGDRVGNHLALVYNRALLPQPPATTDELVRMAVEATVDEDGDGRPDRYGLVFNFVEPFFIIPFITGYGGWVFEAGSETTPALDSEACVQALGFVASLQRTHHVMPANCDYETADALFKEGAAAMIINGDWSWGDYLAYEGLDAAIAPLPVVSSTGLPMGPMVATKGYSLNVHADELQAEAAMSVVQFLTGTETQRVFMERLKILPSRTALLEDPALTGDPTLAASAVQMRQGKPMPVAPELRAVWDAMRPHYQALLAGNRTPREAADAMQRDAQAMIQRMNQEPQPGPAGLLLQAVLVALVVLFLVRQRDAWRQFRIDWRTQRFAYLLVGPALLVIALTIVYPFVYNIILSFSNMSLRNFRDWQITGLQNYAQVFTGAMFYVVLAKTILWTAVCVFFHVVIGLLLAACLNGPVAGKGLYRVLLILPWAIPAYITALTWRGMFNSEYGAVNLIATRLFHLPAVNWLGDETFAFAACIITNIWLGFPFMMIIALGGMQGIPRELYEAAAIDQVSRWNQFRHITLPMLRPVMIPAITLGCIWTFNNLNVVWLVSNGGEPSDQTHILVSYVYKAVFSLYQYGYGAALSMVIFLLLLGFSLQLIRRTRATEAVA
jgi:arabinogalactan oligomer/maltooligosaccharide transport system permease protein